jgi:hypothetical protein
VTNAIVAKLVRTDAPSVLRNEDHASIMGAAGCGLAVGKWIPQLFAVKAGAAQKTTRCVTPH